jgi:hypothetical protein
MTATTRAVLASVLFAAATFGIVSMHEYSRLAAHQPPHRPGIPIPAEVTSFPPSTAWLFALGWAAVIFVVVFGVVLIAGKIATGKNRAPNQHTGMQS